MQYNFYDNPLMRINEFRKWECIFLQKEGKIIQANYLWIVHPGGQILMITGVLVTNRKRAALNG